MTLFDFANSTPKAAEQSSVMTMSRRHFNSYLYQLYDCQRRGVSNDANACMLIEDASHVEVLLSPEGPLIAVHHGPTADLVTVFRANITAADLGSAVI